MRTFVRTIKAVKTLVTVVGKRHVSKDAVVRTLVKHISCAVILLSQALQYAMAQLGCCVRMHRAWALAPAYQRRFVRRESRWCWSRPPQD